MESKFGRRAAARSCLAVGSPAWRLACGSPPFGEAELGEGVELGHPAPCSGQRRGILRAREFGAVDVLVPLLRVHPLHEKPQSERQLGD